MKNLRLILQLLIVTPVFAAPQHLVNPVHWDNAVWTEYGQTFEATAPSMHGVSFHMRNNNGAPGPFEIAVYALPDTDTPIKLHEFSADGSGLDGLVEVAFDSYVSTTVGSNYLFTIKRSTTDTYDIGLYSMSDSYPQGETAVRLGDGTMAFNSSRDLSFAINSGGVDSDGDGLSDYEELQTTYEWISMPTSNDAAQSWENARLDALSRGGHIACINSSNEWDIVHGVIMSNWPFAQIPANEFDALVIWLGGKYNALEGEWEWTTGEQWDVEFWTVQTPPNGGNYLRIGWNALSEYESKNNWNSDYGGYLSGGSHQTNAYYVLEKMIANTDPNDADSDDDGLNDGDEVNTHGTDPNDADSDDDGLNDGDEVATSTAYQIVSGQYTWHDARDGAITNGGHLVTINSEAEWNIVNQLISESGINMFWLGASDENVEGEWEWVTGEPWDFTFWADGEPNNEVLSYKPNGENYLSTWGLEENRWNDADVASGDAGYIVEIESANIGTNPNDADSDDDGLNDGDEVNTYGTDPNDADSDNDGFSDSLEVSMNPVVANSNLWTEIMDANIIKDIRAGSTIIGIDEQSGSGTITMILEETDNLSSSNWTAFGEAINVNITPSNNVRFYRFKMND